MLSLRFKMLDHILAAVAFTISDALIYKYGLLVPKAFGPQFWAAIAGIIVFVFVIQSRGRCILMTSPVTVARYFLYCLLLAYAGSVVDVCSLSTPDKHWIHAPLWVGTLAIPIVALASVAISWQRIAPYVALHREQLINITERQLHLFKEISKLAPFCVLFFGVLIFSLISLIQVLSGDFGDMNSVCSNGWILLPQVLSIILSGWISRNISVEDSLLSDVCIASVILVIRCFLAIVPLDTVHELIIDAKALALSAPIFISLCSLLHLGRRSTTLFPFGIASGSHIILTTWKSETGITHIMLGTCLIISSLFFWRLQIVLDSAELSELSDSTPVDAMTEDTYGTV